MELKELEYKLSQIKTSIGNCICWPSLIDSLKDSLQMDLDSNKFTEGTTIINLKDENNNIESFRIRICVQPIYTKE